MWQHTNKFNSSILDLYSPHSSWVTGSFSRTQLQRVIQFSFAQLRISIFNIFPNLSYYLTTFTDTDQIYFPQTKVIIMEMDYVLICYTMWRQQFWGEWSSAGLWYKPRYDTTMFDIIDQLRCISYTPIRSYCYKQQNVISVTITIFIFLFNNSTLTVKVDSTGNHKVIRVNPLLNIMYIRTAPLIYTVNLAITEDKIPHSVQYDT
jgi:hypothetical protein